jgi:hypothetical protein
VTTIWTLHERNSDTLSKHPQTVLTSRVTIEQAKALAAR